MIILILSIQIQGVLVVSHFNYASQTFFGLRKRYLQLSLKPLETSQNTGFTLFSSVYSMVSNGEGWNKKRGWKNLKQFSLGAGMRISLVEKFLEITKKGTSLRDSR